MQNWRNKCLTGFASGCLMFLAMISSADPAPASRHIDLDLAREAKPLDRFFDLSVGSDYPGTLIRDDCQEQLKTAVDELGFRYIRFHAIFHDVLGTVRVGNGKNVYDWTKIDQLYNDLLAPHQAICRVGLHAERHEDVRQQVFYWQGNTSHPAPAAWKDLIDAFIHHVEKRYGQDEVRTWFFKVWNEPNLSGFWEGADQNAYFELYDLTANTIKVIDPNLRVGGPSTVGAAWVPEFLGHVAQSGAAVDFITTIPTALMVVSWTRTARKTPGCPQPGPTSSAPPPRPNFTKKCSACST